MDFITGFVSLLPVIIAVGLSLYTKRALFSLFCGVLCGSLLLVHNPFHAIVYLVDPLLLDSLADKDALKVIFFSIFVSATVEIMRVGEGTQAVVNIFSRFANTRRKALIGSWLAGLMVFFDDYANCLIVGSTMRPITDKMRISREKLAYIVDSTAAPVATLAIISTWVGYEVSLIDETMQKIPLDLKISMGIEQQSAYAIFLDGIGYRFYPILALIFGFILAISTRDFGPMHTAEEEMQKREYTQNKTETGNLWLGIIPIALLIGVAMWDLYTQGTTKNPSAQSISDIISAADGYDAMLHASIASLVSAYVLSLLYKISTKKISEAIYQSTERILEAISILILAWSIGTVMNDLGSATFLVQILDGVLLVQWLPTVLFVVSAGIAFATGTSFGTMGTIIPLAIPLAMQSGANYEILLASIASVLSGATWGDHCSPISDTTVLSSVGADCDHAKHVETQLPYALVSGIISILCCSIPVGFGVPWYICVGIATIVCTIVIWCIGKPLSTSIPTKEQ